jgi:hypothetical protein
MLYLMAKRTPLVRLAHPKVNPVARRPHTALSWGRLRDVPQVRNFARCFVVLAGVPVHGVLLRLTDNHFIASGDNVMVKRGRGATDEEQQGD